MILGVRLELGQIKMEEWGILRPWSNLLNHTTHHNLLKQMNNLTWNLSPYIDKSLT